MKPRYLFFLAAFTLCVATAEGADLRQKKFIELGWDIPSTAFMRTNCVEMERTTPFDGVMFKVEPKDESGRKITSQAFWSAKPWDRSWLQPALDDLKACKFSKFTDNFLRLNATPGNLQWDDEEGWKTLAEKAGHCAWLMRQAKCKGLAVDFESYGSHQFQFDGTKGRTFTDTVVLARKRGAEFTRAIANEFPNAVLLALWLNSINFEAGRLTVHEAVLASHTYGLLPAFIDGMLDAAPPKMVLVDGCEHGYYMDSAETYLRAAHEMRSWNGSAISLVSPENRARYRQQVQAGFGFYLDMFLNKEGNRYYFPPLDGSRLARLERNLRFALDACDEYVWIYGEQCRWWNMPVNASKSVGQGRYWEEAMPGILKTIAFVRDPIGAAKTELAHLRESGSLTNLVKNADFSAPANQKPGVRPAEFSVWQDTKISAGKFAWDGAVGNGSARATKVSRGCFIQAVPVQPGETYAVEVQCKTAGNSLPTLTVRWQKADRTWTQQHLDCTFAFEPGAEWRKAFGIVTVPADAGRLVILLNVAGQSRDEDVCWFDNLALYRWTPTPR